MEKESTSQKRPPLHRKIPKKFENFSNLAEKTYEDLDFT